MNGSSELPAPTSTAHFICGFVTLPPAESADPGIAGVPRGCSGKAHSQCAWPSPTRLDLGVARGLLGLVSDDADGARQSLAPALEEAQASGFTVLGWRLQSALGEAWARADPHGPGVGLCRAALGQLRALRQVPAQAEAAARLVRAEGPRVDPEVAWSGLDPWLQSEAVHPFRLERALGELAFAEHAGLPARAKAARDQAELSLSRIRSVLSETDAAALRVHPWQARIDRSGPPKR